MSYNHRNPSCIMNKLKAFFKTPKRRGLILGLFGIVTIFTLTYNPVITQPVDGINNDFLVATEVFLLIPLIIILLIVGFVPYLAKGAEKMDSSIKKAIVAPLNVYDRNFLSFCLWGGFLGFSISTFIAVNSLDLILDTTFIIPPELSKDLVNLFLYTLRNPGPSYVITIMVIPLLGYALFFIYKIVYFGTIMKLEKNEDSTLNQSKYQKIGKFSIFVLLISVFGVITYLHTMLSGNFEKLEDWNKILIMFLPFYSLGMSVFMVFAIFFIRVCYLIVGYKENLEKK